MGRGDKRSKRGKRTLGSFGVKRQSRVQNKVLKNIAVEQATEKEKPAKATKAKAAPKAKKEKEA